MSGWFAVKRGITSHPIFNKRHDRLYVWLWMLEKAAWKDTTQDASGACVTVLRGQLLTSFRQMEAATGVSVKTLRVLIARLRAESVIDTDTGTGRLLITIRNYEKYQAQADAKGTAGGTARAQQGHTKEQENKPNKKKVETDVSTLRGGAAPDGFNSFWGAYPHRAGVKRGRKPAAAKYAAALKAGATPEDILDGAKRAHRDPTVIRGFARDPAAWLHQAGWQDDIPSNVTSFVRSGDAIQYGEERVNSKGQRMRYVGGHQQWLPVHA